MSATPAEQLIDLGGQRLGEATQRVLGLAGQLGYTAAAAGPGQYRLARARRRLLGKDTESVHVTVYEDRTGTKARFVGDVDPALVEHLGGAPAATPVVEPTHVPQGPAPHAAVRDFTPSGPPPAMPAPIARPAPAPAGPPGGLIGSVPGAVPRAAMPALRPVEPPIRTDTAELDERTTINVRRDPVGVAPGSEGGLRLPDGRFVSLATPVVIGRSPDPARGLPGSLAISVAEPSLSKTHLLVVKRGIGVLVSDLHSSNGTVIDTDGRRVRCEPGVEVLVPPGSVVLAGALVIEVVGT